MRQVPEQLLWRVILVPAGYAEATSYLRGHELGERGVHGAHVRHDRASGGVVCPADRQGARQVVDGERPEAGAPASWSCWRSPRSQLSAEWARRKWAAAADSAALRVRFHAAGEAMTLLIHGARPRRGEGVAAN